MAIETAKLVVTADVSNFARGAQEVGVSASAMAEKVKVVGESTKATSAALDGAASSMKKLGGTVADIDGGLKGLSASAADFGRSFVDGAAAAVKGAQRILGALRLVRESIMTIRNMSRDGILAWAGLPEVQDYLFHRRTQARGRSQFDFDQNIRGLYGMGPREDTGLREQTRFDASILASILGVTGAAQQRASDLSGVRSLRSTVGGIAGAAPGFLGQLGVIDDRALWELAKMRASRGGGSRATDTAWSWGDLFSQSPTQAAIGGGFRSLWGAVSNPFPSSVSGSVSAAAGGVFGAIGGAVRGIGSSVGGALKPGQDRDEKMREFSSSLNDTSTLVGGAYSTMTAGLTAAVDAAITGSAAIGAAFRQAAGAALKSLAIESTVRAAYNTAMGLGALVFRPDAAAGYFAAAAQFSATAVLAGAGSSLLGGGGSGGGGAPSSGPRSVPYVGGGGGGGGGGPQTIVVNVGGGIVASPNELGRVIAEAVNQGRRAGRVRDEKNVVVRYE